MGALPELGWNLADWRMLLVTFASYFAASRADGSQFEVPMQYIVPAHFPLHFPAPFPALSDLLSLTFSDLPSLTFSNLL